MVAADLVHDRRGCAIAVERIPDPGDRRARLVRATDRGREVDAIAREVIGELEREWTARLGARRMRELRALLEERSRGL